MIKMNGFPSQVSRNASLFQTNLISTFLLHSYSRKNQQISIVHEWNRKLMKCAIQFYIVKSEKFISSLWELPKKKSKAWLLFKIPITMYYCEEQISLNLKKLH